MSDPAERPRPLLREPGFRSFFLAHTVSQFGDRISELAFPLLAVLLLDASAAQVSVLTALVWLPNLAGIFIGTWVDRQPNKKRLLVAADLIRAGLLVTVPLAFAFDAGTLAQLYAVALLTGAASVLFNTSYPAFFVLLVDRSRYLPANSALSASRSVSFIAGPALGGLLVQALTAPIAILVDAVSFLLSAVGVARARTTRVPASDGDAATGRLWQRAREGLRFTLAHPVLRAGLGCATTVNYFSFIFSALLVFFASRTLGLPPGLLGLALGVGAAGGLLGAVVAPRLSARIGVGRSIMLGAVVFPASTALVAVAGGPLWLRVALVAGAEFLSGVGVMLFDVNLNALQATVIPDGLRSRVSGAFSTVNYGIRPLGALTGGALGSWLGLRPTLWLAAIGGTLCVLWLLPSPIPTVRSLDQIDVPDRSDLAAAER
ncbi:MULTISPECIES: MFS transporter [Micromonospora]|uniref:MFS transporter n=1 Tax=Micromonospora solifontis TaxID=2487138 RepID=A0ABX9W8U7_9ACTN|nr:MULTISPECIES: MFS transporter [Micromonospora]NES15383.1 MFS transporter [Micromonospora sp. PPF5-17B]NES39531.1 MFS transporter [Micromonospora solifontis]NES56731.1 MFS transporter [Micromonospora sp. PPF5-6]RNL88334.1 MFS transporter [Micromonospora solifontis]